MSGDQSRKRVLITGSNGVLGTKLIEAAIADHEVIATDLQPEALNSFLGTFTYVPMDITEQAQVARVFEQFRPSLVIHAGAYTDVDGAEKNRDLCYQVNVIGTQHVAVAVQGKLVYVSTDYVFDGTSGPYREGDAVHPLGWYGETKHQGEQAASNNADDVLICRTSTLYGFAPNITKYNFVGWVLRQLEQGRQARVATDQYVNHTIAEDLAATVLALAASGQRGVYHTAGEDRLSRFEFARRAAEQFGFDPSLLIPATCAELGWTALRPLEGGFVMDKLHQHLTMMGTEQQLAIIRNTFPWANATA